MRVDLKPSQNSVFKEEKGYTLREEVYDGPPELDEAGKGSVWHSARPKALWIPLI